jgi:hypothetical protein
MRASLLPTTRDHIPEGAVVRAREICERIEWLERAWVVRVETTSGGPEPRISETTELFLWLGENQHRLHYDQRFWPGTDEPIGSQVVPWDTLPASRRNTRNSSNCSPTGRCRSRTRSLRSIAWASY